MRKAVVITSAAVILTACWLAWKQFGGEHSDPPPSQSRETPPTPIAPLPGTLLLDGWGEAETPPVEDLRKLRALTLGYFSVIKDLSRHPIGGNADLAACLLGDNPEQKAFIDASHPALNAGRLIIDRWGTPIFVHPEAARELTLRSAGPDQTLFTADDLILAPDGREVPAEP